jgi:hypothetical protein
MIPNKPFPSFKWRWLSVAPTEGLLTAPVFLGVLRAFYRNESKSTSSEDLLGDLAKVQVETKTDVNLIRTGERNLIRNSGQYWKGTGLLSQKRGIIELTPLGRLVAEGAVTQYEFASIMIQQTVLPNPLTYSESEVELWKAHNLEIHPLSLILEVIRELWRKSSDSNQAFITPWELIRIVIPLSGDKNDAVEIAAYIISHRNGQLDLTGWPDCTPDANDRRIAREFLLFLANFGFCRTVEHANILEQKFFMDELFEDLALQSKSTNSIYSTNVKTDEIVDEIRQSALPTIVERQRVTTSVLSRSGQSKFSKNVMNSYYSTCLLTGETIKETLEAAHIIPVSYGGSDSNDNGICLRVDIHRLFDSGNIRFLPNGKIVLSDAVKSSKNYSVLPSNIEFPSFVSQANVQWRLDYC